MAGGGGAPLNLDLGFLVTKRFSLESHPCYGGDRPGLDRTNFYSLCFGFLHSAAVGPGGETGRHYPPLFSGFIFVGDPSLGSSELGVKAQRERGMHARRWRKENT